MKLSISFRSVCFYSTLILRNVSSRFKRFRTETFQIKNRFETFRKIFCACVSFPNVSHLFCLVHVSKRLLEFKNYINRFKTLRNGSKRFSKSNLLKTLSIMLFFFLEISLILSRSRLFVISNYNESCNVVSL